MLHALTIAFAAIGLGIPIGVRMELNPLAVGLLCGGLNALLSVIFKIY